MLKGTEEVNKIERDRFDPGPVPENETATFVKNVDIDFNKIDKSLSIPYYAAPFTLYGKE